MQIVCFGDRQFQRLMSAAISCHPRVYRAGAARLESVRKTLERTLNLALQRVVLIQLLRGIREQRTAQIRIVKDGCGVI